MSVTRRTIDLNGTWDFCPIYNVHHDLSLPEVSKYETITVPSSFRYEGIGYNDFKPYNLFDYPHEWNDAATAVYRRTFVLPDDVKPGKYSVILHSENTAQKAAFYVNGELAAVWDEMFLPLDADITDYLKPGENVINVVVTDFEKVKIASGAEKVVYLLGSFLKESYRGIWGNISLEILPSIHISDVAVRTSVRKGTIEVITEISDDCDADVDVRILDGDKAVLSFSGKPGSIVSEWKDPEYWDIENPKLYYAEVTLKVNGETTDVKTARFGFREIWNEGTQFILNGTPINLRGDSWHFHGVVQMTKEYAHNWYTLCKENGVNYIRLHANPHPTYYLDAADEDGMLIVDETAIYGSGKSMDSAHPDYIENCRKHCTRLVRRDRNHPSVVFWSLQNEMRWVDGRDIYKTYIPELMSIMHKEDPTRFVSLDGDNRLISYENTEVESLHYNIDGTLEQWRREKPLTIGEHGGMWYLCPQNSSQYTGLVAYDNFEPCAIGYAIKERLFQEDARRKGVSGISTFNFAYYFTRSMPDEDVFPENAPFKKIPKYSLTINNGYLPKKYPLYRENPLMPFMREAYRPVTVINREYNRNFYSSKKFERSFDVYNDTLHAHEAAVKYSFSVGGKVIKTGEETFTHMPAENHVVSLSFDVPEITSKSAASLTVTLCHDGKEAFSREWEYNFYPETIKNEPVKTEKKIFFIGDEGFENVLAVCPDAKKISSPCEAETGSLLVLGARLSLNPNDIAPALDRFVSEGGSLVVFEQSTMVIGDLALSNQDFFSAFASNHDHPLLDSISDEDMIYWGPSITEDRPEAIIHRNYKKPASGEYTFVLESGKGDYADGGDLWSPLMTMKHGKGEIVFCQLELTENYEKVPQACVLLRNILAYAGNLSANEYVSVSACGEKADAFLNVTGIKKSEGEMDRNGIILADIASADPDELKSFIEAGGSVLTLPVSPEDKDKLDKISGSDVSFVRRDISHAKCSGSSLITLNLSPVDLFRYDKVAMSPRQVINRRIAEYGVVCENGRSLIKDVTNTIWEDSFWNRIRSEPCIIPMVSFTREVPVEPVTLLCEIPVGRGKLYVSTMAANDWDEKDINVYTKLLENLGAETKTSLFSFVRTPANEAVEYFMTLPMEKWQDTDKARAYYTDPAYSLNNLGEGLYGWMKKVEKNYENGYITVPDSKGRMYFLTCFADKEKGEEVLLNVEANAENVFYLNGQKVESGKVFLPEGANRLVLEAQSSPDELLKFRVVITKTDGTPLSDMRTHTTIDEVDPK